MCIGQRASQRHSHTPPIVITIYKRPLLIILVTHMRRVDPVGERHFTGHRNDLVEPLAPS